MAAASECARPCSAALLQQPSPVRRCRREGKQGGHQKYAFEHLVSNSVIKRHRASRSLALRQLHLRPVESQQATLSYFSTISRHTISEKNVKPSIRAAAIIMFVPIRPPASGCRAMASTACPPIRPIPSPLPSVANPAPMPAPSHPSPLSPTKLDACASNIRHNVLLPDSSRKICDAKGPY